jgi:hypothetical protein
MVNFKKCIFSKFYISIVFIVLISIISYVTKFYLSHDTKSNEKIKMKPISNLKLKERSKIFNNTQSIISKQILTKQYINTNNINKLENISNNLENENLILNQKSKFAYVTLLSGIDTTFQYRGFLYNTLIMKKSLNDLGSTADFIVLIGYSNEDDTKPFESDINLLRNYGIIIYNLTRLINDNKPLKFMEMALLKITPYSFIQYERIQFFDGDVMPIKDMDIFFKIDKNTYNTGNASPVNSGWCLLIPNMGDYIEMKEIAIKRLLNPWNEIKGWGREIPIGLMFRGGFKQVQTWNFNGASLDQGLITHYFVLTHGNIMLLDTSEAISYYENFNMSKVPLNNFINKCCNKNIPIQSFAHFTGKSKPWLRDEKLVKNGGSGSKKNASPTLVKWFQLLDSLHLDINSTNVHLISLKSPLGYFAANK